MNRLALATASAALLLLTGALAHALAADAVETLRQAHAARATWGPGFRGFTAHARLQIDGHETEGRITVGPDFKTDYGDLDPEAVKILREDWESHIMHRRPGPLRESAVTWRDEKPHPMGRAVSLNDPLQSFYRVRDNQILQVNRTMGATRFTINVLDNWKSPAGYLPRVFTVGYYDRETGRLQASSTTRATWVMKDEQFLPKTLEVVSNGPDGQSITRLLLTDHRLTK